MAGIKSFPARVKRTIELVMADIETSEAIIALGQDFCARYGFMETLETAILTCIAEVFLTLRVYALLSKHKAVLGVALPIILFQWGIALYAMSQSSKGTDQVVLLIPGAIPPNLPTLPDIDPYHSRPFVTVNVQNG
ncbi:hypothetical protein H0H92_007244 [Tricholoma furcatifolium]|nr:hypothetical protein H0H92_007244 [Tricholoma furcatifolium]